MPNKIEIRIAGHGGQGVVLAGQILGKAAAYDGKNVLQTQTYGAEARGSMARSEVIISDSKIGFPAVRKCDVLVAMNQESLDVHLRHLKEDGILIIDTSTVQKIPETKIRTVRIPITDVTRKTFGESTYANIVMLGVLVKITKLASKKSMEKAIEESVPEKTIETNVKAFKKGLELV